MDPSATLSIALTAATSNPGWGEPVPFPVGPGLYELRATGPCMLCKGNQASDGGVLVTPDLPARVVVASEKFIVAAMSDACTLTVIPLLDVEQARERQQAREASRAAARRLARGGC